MRERLALEDAVRGVEEEAVQLGRDAPNLNYDDLAADSDLRTAVEIPFMILTGGATGRLNRVWRYAWH
jgi:hypothetical protein